MVYQIKRVECEQFDQTYGRNQQNFVFSLDPFEFSTEKIDQLYFVKVC